jgi:predicted porin
MNSTRRALPLAVAALFLGGTGPARADDSNVALYGVLDTAVAYIQHALNFDADHPVSNNPTVTKGTQAATGLLNGGMSATRWGIKGQEDMGDGMKAVFTLESAFNIPSGALSNAALAMAHNTSTGPAMSADSAISGQFFARGAFVGLSSTSWGTLTAGRQQSFFLDNIPQFDAILGSQAFSPLGFSGTYGGGGFTDDSRVDNSLKYVVPVGDFTLGALYKFGGVAGSTSAQSAYELNGVYSSGPLAVQLGYEAFKDALSLTNATGTGTLKATAADTKSYMLSAKYTWEQTTLRAGFEREEYDNPSNPDSDKLITSVFGISLAAAPTVDAYDNQKTLNVFWLGVQEDFSPGFSLLVGAYHVAQNDYDCPKSSAAGCSGSLNYYSVVADYKFSKRTDSYLGFMESTVSGGPANAVIITGTTPAETSNRIFALGLRHRF